MSVDLEKNKTSILEAYKDVISDQTETNWWVKQIKIGSSFLSAQIAVVVIF